MRKSSKCSYGAGLWLRLMPLVSDAYAGAKRYIRLPESEHNAILHGPSVAEYQAALDWLWSSALEEGDERGDAIGGRQEPDISDLRSPR